MYKRQPRYRGSQSIPREACRLDDRLTGAEFTVREGRHGTEIVIDDLDALSALRKAGKEAKVSLRLVDYRLPAL